MISILILLVLAWAFYIGYSRGLVLQVFYSIGALVAILLAGSHYQSWVKLLSLWVPYASPGEGASTYFYPASQLFDLDQVFYAGLAFLLVFTVVYCLVRLLGIFAHLVPNYFEEVLWANLVSGVLSLLVTAFVLQMLLTILSTVPLPLVQNQLNSGLARMMIQSPLTGDYLKSIWMTQITR